MPGTESALSPSIITIICCVDWYRTCPSLGLRFSTYEDILGLGMEFSWS